MIFLSSMVLYQILSICFDSLLLEDENFIKFCTILTISVRLFLRWGRKEKVESNVIPTVACSLILDYDCPI